MNIYSVLSTNISSQQATEDPEEDLQQATFYRGSRGEGSTPTGDKRRG
jgi:hypothetical protein